MSPEVHKDDQSALVRVAEAAQRFGSAALKRALEPTVVPFDHFPGESRQFVRREFPGFTSSPEVGSPAA